MKQLSIERYEDETIGCEYQCDVFICLKDGRRAKGVGVAKYAGKDITLVLDNTQKFAVTNARKQAFQKLALVILASGKAAVHILDEYKEETEESLVKDELALYGSYLKLVSYSTMRALSCLNCLRHPFLNISYSLLA